MDSTTTKTPLHSFMFQPTSCLGSPLRFQSIVKLLEQSCSSSKKIGGGGIRRSTASPAVERSVKEGRLPADLHVNETKAPNSKFPEIVCGDCYQRVLTKFMKMFRPGERERVPENNIVGFVWRQYVLRATVESILKRTLLHAMESVTGKALKDSIQIVSSFPEMEKAYSQLNYEVVVDVVPENGYKDMKIVGRSLIYISATTIDEDGSTGQAIPDAESKGFHFDSEEGNKLLLPGFLDSILGIRAGKIKVDCKELFYRDLPTLDDSLADKLLPGCGCQEMEQEAKEQATDNAILEQIRKGNMKLAEDQLVSLSISSQKTSK
ncbi:hypothetical protein N665_0705s0022 [Sinapis alba]|nr:hypothetical protein N665_0705s0022 [Sinapis alba]